MGFLLLSNSATANGSGGATINLINEESAYYNPGALGLYHMNHRLGLSLPNENRVTPVLSEGVTLNTWGVSVGLFRRDPQNVANFFSPRSVSIAYSKADFSSGVFRITDPIANIGITVGILEERSENISLAMGFSGRVELGIGISYKRVSTELEAEPVLPFPSLISFDQDAASFDLGVILRIPLYNQEGDGDKGVLEEVPRFEIFSSLAYVRANLGNTVTHIDPGQASNLPEISRIGLALDGILRRNGTIFLTSRMTYEAEFDHVGTIERVDRFGAEIGYADAIFLRAGLFTQSDTTENVNTWGFGGSLRGIMSLFRSLNERQILAETPNEHSLDLFDVRFDYASLSGGVYDGSKFARVSISYGR